MADSHGKMKSPKLLRITPKYVQIQAVIQLGSKQLSFQTFTPLMKFDNLEDLHLELKFFKGTGKLKKKNLGE